MTSSNAPVFIETAPFVQCTFQNSVKNHQTWSKGHCLWLSSALTTAPFGPAISGVPCRASKSPKGSCTSLHGLAGEEQPSHQMQGVWDNQTLAQTVIYHHVVIPFMAFGYLLVKTLFFSSFSSWYDFMPRVSQPCWFVTPQTCFPTSRQTYLGFHCKLFNTPGPVNSLICTDKLCGALIA